MECLTCLNLSGERRISPGPYIYQGESWVVDHAYPTSHPGWLVILPRRHIEALHELSKEEFQELAEIEYKLVQAMHTDPAVQKEYMMCFAEGQGFHHVHIHVVPKPANLPEHLKGPRIFELLKVEGEQALSAEALTAFCEEFTRKLQAVR
ncbi:HIT family protein [Ktedonosporobacter rubrisoli]|uniref:HIT family protein n=1 Tax=Ktedonosporobacter rubrisoli TaxID=2509675 RepID=A0A4P6JRU4_KTERU|nr:HIT family protein [Ktedonosporobacter rubrisoli]QBD78043.1 HIT family protein [Ktedonosporobacter rubrisoli]